MKPPRRLREPSERTKLRRSTPPEDWPAVSRTLARTARSIRAAATIRQYAPALKGQPDRCTYCGEAITGGGCAVDHAPALYHLAEQPGRTGWLLPCCGECNAGAGPSPATCAIDRATVILDRPLLRRARNRPGAGERKADRERKDSAIKARLASGAIFDLCPCPSCEHIRRYQGNEPDRGPKAP